jgi:hypothetical protein
MVLTPGLVLKVPSVSKVGWLYQKSPGGLEGWGS